VKLTNHVVIIQVGIILLITICLLAQVGLYQSKTSVLTWDNPTEASNKVYWGESRGNWTNNVIVTTNEYTISSGLHYAITAIVNGVESSPAFWPSNRIDRIWVQESFDALQWTNAFIWKTNMNRPQEFLRLNHELIGWE